MRSIETILACLGSLAAYFGIMLLILLVHEAGHFFAGWFVGLRWQAFHVGPIQVKRGETRLHLVSDENWQGGNVTFSMEVFPHTRLRWVFVVLAGSAANLLLTLILIVVSIHEPLRVQQTDGWLPAIGGYSALLGFINMLPFRHRHNRQPSDGLLLLEVWREGRRSKTRRTNPLELRRYP